MVRPNAGFPSSESTAAGVGIDAADLHEMYNAGFVSIGRSFDRVCLLLQNLGRADDETGDGTPYGIAPGLMSHIDDKVVTTDAGGKNGVRCPFHENGTAANLTFCNDILASYKAEILGRVLPFTLTHLHQDNEEYPTPGHALQPGASDVGNWLPTLADARSGTEVLDGTDVWDDLWGNALDINGNPITVTAPGSWFQSSNIRATEFIEWSAFNILEYAMKQTLGAARDTHFPGVPISNYNVQHRSAAFPTINRVHASTEETYWGFNNPLDHLDMSAPVCYPPAGSFFDTADGEGSLLAPVLEAFGLTRIEHADLETELQLNIQQITVARAKNRIDAAAAHPSKDMAIWLDMVGDLWEHQRIAIGEGLYADTAAYVAGPGFFVEHTYAMALEIGKYAIDNNCKEILHFILPNASIINLGLSPSVVWSNTRTLALELQAYEEAGELDPVPITIHSTSPLPEAENGTEYTFIFSASGGTAPYTWSLFAGVLPSGLTVDPAGVLSGTPTESGTFNFRIRVQDSLGDFITKVFALTVVTAPEEPDPPIPPPPDPPSGGVAVGGYLTSRSLTNDMRDDVLTLSIAFPFEGQRAFLVGRALAAFSLTGLKIRTASGTCDVNVLISSVQADFTEENSSGSVSADAGSSEGWNFYTPDTFGNHIVGQNGSLSFELINISSDCEGFEIEIEIMTRQEIPL